MTKTLKVFMFGQFSTCSNLGLMEGFKSQKAQELFCYLLLFRDRAHHREVLSDVFWGEQQNARKYLRKALWQLQSDLKPLNEITDQPILWVDAEWLQVNPSAPVWVDAHAFEQVYQSIRRIHGRDLSSTEFASLRGILELYTGDLLERLYSDWCIFERERYRDIYLTLVSKLMSYCSVHQEYETGIKYGKLVLRTDRVHERTHRKLMRLYYQAGERIAAIRQYEECKAALAEELSVQPSKLTEDLYDQILRDRSPVAPESMPHPEQIARSLQRIRQLMEMQTEIDQRLPQEIQKLEQALSERE